jgi:hypothetical protein
MENKKRNQISLNGIKLTPWIEKEEYKPISMLEIFELALDNLKNKTRGK